MDRLETVDACLDCEPTCACPDGVGEREFGVLWELSRLGDAEVAFSGIRRRLDLHQESLTRTLDRLARDGLVEDTGDGYALTREGYEAIRACDGPASRPTLRPIVAASIPPTVDPEQVEEGLSGRWFDGLHWYGRADGPGEITLAWLTDPGRQMVQVRVAGGTLTVETEADVDDPEAIRAVGALLAALTDLYDPSAA